MKKNCLVTKLRALVDDDSLEILDDGTIRFTYRTIENNGKKVVSLGCCGPTEIIVTGATIIGILGDASVNEYEGNVYRYTGNSFTGVYSGFIIDEDVDFVKLIIKNGVENITNIQSTDIDIDNIGTEVRLLRLTVFVGGKSYSHTPFYLTELPLQQMANISSIAAFSVKGNTSDLALLPNKNSLSNIAFNEATDFIGDISALAVFPNISVINLTRSGTSGSIEDFVLATNRDSGNILIGYDMGVGSTFDGSLVDGTFNKTLTWSTSSNDITITILRDSDGSVWKTKTISKNA